MSRNTEVEESKLAAAAQPAGSPAITLSNAAAITNGAMVASAQRALAVEPDYLQNHPAEVSKQDHKSVEITASPIAVTETTRSTLEYRPSWIQMGWSKITSFFGQIVSSIRSGFGSVMQGASRLGMILLGVGGLGLVSSQRAFSYESSSSDQPKEKSAEVPSPEMEVSEHREIRTFHLDFLNRDGGSREDQLRLEFAQALEKLAEDVRKAREIEKREEEAADEEELAEAAEMISLIKELERDFPEFRDLLEQLGHAISHHRADFLDYLSETSLRKILQELRAKKSSTDSQFA